MEDLLIAGVFLAAFVGINIGGSSTGVAFGPAIGANAITQVGAGVLMSISAIIGGWTIGRNVVTTVGNDIVATPVFSLSAGFIVLACIGVTLLVANVLGIPTSTSMVAVGAMVGMGIGNAGVEWGVLVRIARWWVVAPVLAFGIAAAIGRWKYDEIAAFGGISEPTTSPVTLRWTAGRPELEIAEDASSSDIWSTVLLLVIACYMGFSAGASNVANAVAPLVGSGMVSLDAAILVAVGAISFGAFTIARRTMATVGSDLTALPMTAAVVVATIGATITTGLSYLGIPASLALSTVTAIIGLGWGRAQRGKSRVAPSPPATREETVRCEKTPSYAVHPSAVTLFQGSMVARVLAVWMIAPLAAGGAALAVTISLL
ncbi:inorganic phosphate transporter [Halorubrum ezzemoulense]|uniref:Phosphate transporter n=1 Tax=Halorubrum ezzemoulense TaxID=337243 RepID=A0A256JLB0_HALEZ|nr:inorganic phosphate transporter [Halorubrum ezzemoulense]MDB2262052.1 inorganic phosphate transporter [Halorubrum ezzemoulense]MDB2268899.1 inorganic phosphate transporter [Halorubrum ezzemoulense]OYR69373.1 inorganic phosphate transporter [Halorubrum ezzemoulense]